MSALDSASGGGSVRSAAHAVHGKSSVISAIFNFSKAMLGAGIFSMPQAMVESGFFATFVLMIFSTLIIYWSSVVLMRASERFGTSTYGSTLRAVLKKPGGYLENTFTGLLTFGSLVAYCILISDSLPPLLIHVSGWTDKCLSDKNCKTPGVSRARFFLDRRVLLGIAGLLVLLPLIVAPSIHFLSCTSVFGLCCVLVIIICLAERAITAQPEDKGTLEGSNLYSIVILTGIAGATSKSAFANICQHAQFLIFNSLKRPTFSNSCLVLISTLIISTATNLIFSTLVYIPLNDKIGGNIFNSFSDKDIVVNVCRFLLSMSIMCTYPIQGHVCSNVIVEAIHGTNPKHRERLCMIYGALVFLSTWILGMIFSDLGSIVNLTGGIAASSLSFVLPSLCAILVARQDKKSIKSYIIPGFVLLFGIILSILTIIMVATSSRGPAKKVAYKYI